MTNAQEELLLPPGTEARRLAYRDARVKQRAFGLTVLAVFAPRYFAVDFAGMSGDDVADRMEKNVLSVRPVLTRLMQQGYLERTPFFHRSRMGRPVHCLRMTSAGADYLRTNS
jgi:hypothetical protein